MYYRVENEYLSIRIKELHEGEEERRKLNQSIDI